ncbi:hypothetical protein [Salinibacter altiplanensis]|uniref:hypothetical protein n=1 Tax=Salinibacter altiplanensis TaxID=1803181 RepID=UPI000C9FAFA7|nr:hypothetical protein [Salinibacter altiplanensis]
MDSRKEQLVAFGMMFVTIGLAIDATTSQEAVSFICLGLGLVLSFVAVVLSDEEENASSEGQLNET